MIWFGLKKYYNRLITDINEVELLESVGIRLKNNPAILGIVLDKLKRCKDNGVEFYIEIDHVVEELGCKNFNAARVLGILIDNAIEASLECEKKMVFLKFTKSIVNSNGNEKQEESIEIKNTYIDIGLDMDKMYDKYYTTKNNGKNQGLGLWKVGKIVRKNDDLEIYTTVNEEIFIQNLKICV